MTKTANHQMIDFIYRFVVKGFCFFFLVFNLLGCNVHDAEKSTFEYKITEVYLDENGDTLSFCKLFPDSSKVSYDYFDYENKVLRSITNFNSKNELHGQRLIYHENQNIFVDMEYLNGLIWNIKEVKNENGEVLNFGNLKNGNGSLKSYYPSGRIKRDGMIIDGLREGIWYSYLESGFVIDTLVYSKGECPTCFFLDNLYP